MDGDPQRSSRVSDKILKVFEDIEDKKITGVWENERCGIQRNLPKNIQKFIEGKL